MCALYDITGNSLGSTKENLPEKQQELEAKINRKFKELQKLCDNAAENEMSINLIIRTHDWAKQHIKIRKGNF